MKNRPRVVWCSWAVVYGFATACFAATVTFDSALKFPDGDPSKSEPLNAGDQFGASFESIPGVPVLSEDGIVMSFENFRLEVLPPFTGFFRAVVVGPDPNLFATNALGLDNISIEFNVSGLGFDVTQVMLDFHAGGDLHNLGVNGVVIGIDPDPGLRIDRLLDPVEVAPNIFASVELSSLAGGTLSVIAENDAFIDSILIGGQELFIDNIVAVPEPGSVALVGLAGLLLLARRSRAGRRDVG